MRIHTFTGAVIAVTRNLFLLAHARSTLALSLFFFSHPSPSEGMKKKTKEKLDAINRFFYIIYVYIFSFFLLLLVSLSPSLKTLPSSTLASLSLSPFTVFFLSPSIAIESWTRLTIQWPRFPAKQDECWEKSLHRCYHTCYSSSLRSCVPRSPLMASRAWRSDQTLTTEHQDAPRALFPSPRSFYRCRRS